MALRASTDTTDGDLFMIVNGENTADIEQSIGHAGELIVFMLNRGQNVVAPSHFITDGVFTDVAVDVDEIYVVVKRSIGGSDKYYVEVFDDDFTTDVTTQKTSSFSGDKLFWS